MRLIDADVAIEELTDRSHQAAKRVGTDSPFWEGLVIARRIVNNLPTIQSEAKRGHWIKHIDPSDGEQYECSECGVLWEFNDGTPEDNEAYFCPKCGAKMTISTK